MMPTFEFTDRFDRVNGGEISLEIIEKFQGTENILPFYWWNIMVNGTSVGKISLRVGNARSSVDYCFNGNVGYEVDEPFRGHNYAETAARLIMPIAKQHGMSELIFTCDESNIASYKTIENLGARILGIFDVPREYFAWYEGMERQRIYRIAL